MEGQITSSRLKYKHETLIAQGHACHISFLRYCLRSLLYRHVGSIESVCINTRDLADTLFYIRDTAVFYKLMQRQSVLWDREANVRESRNHKPLLPGSSPSSVT